MNALVPCHSSQPKSLSKSSVMVYHGMCCQPICALTRSMSACRAGGADPRAGGAGVGGGQCAPERVVGGVEGAKVASWRRHKRTADAGVFGPAMNVGLEECAVHD